MKNINSFIILMRFFLLPFILFYKTIKWGWSKNRIVTITAVGIILLIGAIGSAAEPVPFGFLKQEEQALSDKASKVSGQLKVHFLDVGQADSILVQSPSGRIMLIDAGNNGDANTVTGYLRDQGIKRIDVLIGTHPHEDHIGGLDSIITGFSIKKIYMPKASTTTKTFEDVLTAAKNKGLKINSAEAGITLDMGVGLKAEILAPNGTVYEDLNNFSAVVKLTYGVTSFLLTGDAESASEGEMLEKRYDLKADVLKIGHHGSSSSTTVEFLNSISPSYAVISVGQGNDYGHPHRSIMHRLQSKGIKVYRTDQNGTIVAISNGEKIRFSTEPGD